MFQALRECEVEPALAERLEKSFFDTADLGNLQTGTLKHDGGGASPDWTPEYVRITNDEDGRIWLAPVNTELKGNQVQLEAHGGFLRREGDFRKRKKPAVREQRRLRRVQLAIGSGTCAPAADQYMR